MLLQTTKRVTTVEDLPITIEVQTPFFSKRNQYGHPEYFAIEESKDGPSVVHLFISEHYGSMNVFSSKHNEFGKTADAALKAEQITEEDFLRALVKLIPASNHDLIDC